ncbi:transcriptional regulator, partial [Spirillospora sp. NPDC049652]
MLELTFSADDLACTRFAISPLWEAVAAVRTLKYPDEHPLHRRWAEAVRPRLAASGTRLGPLAELVGPRLIAAFACPPPTSPTPDLDLELAALRRQPHDRVAADRAAL